MLDFTAIRHDSLQRYLANHIAGEVRFDDTTRKLYATDASHYQVLPLGVVLPRTVADLMAAVQVASELGIPITPRGGGTSLSGQAIGAGLILDCSKYLNRIFDLDPTQRTVRVHPGVVLDHLNAEVAEHGLMFGPDVAPASRATLGGMIGNNSAGSRSVAYGQTVSHVRSLRAVLSDGRLTSFGPLTPLEYQQKLEQRTREGEAYRTAAAIVRDHAAEIDRRFPKILRRVSGYNLPGLLGREHSLVPLLVGSEGTLMVLAEAELALVPKPKHRAVLVPHFDSLTSALNAVGVCLEYRPSAVELIDQMFIDLARAQRSLSRTMSAIQGRPKALLIVEFSAESEADLADRIEKLTQRLRSVGGMTVAVPAVEASLRDALWGLRGAGMGLLSGLPGARKPVTFVEDCAVSPEKLPEFTARFREILQRRGTDGAFYGHASVGCLHIRPLLDLHSIADVRLMRSITEEVTALVLEFHGSLSGEHGDGMVRSEWNRTMFGETIYNAFRAVKHAFDPENIFNPGKIVNGPAMEENFRVPPGTTPPDPVTVLDFSNQGGFFGSVEMCNGNAACRKTQGGAMCPSYRATHDERDSTRGRANAVRTAMTLAPVSPRNLPLEQRWVAEVMDLCLSCKACKAECPSNVDLAKIKAEFLHAFYSRRPRPVLHRLLKRIHTLSPLAARWAGIGNWFGRRRLLRRLLQAAVGVDRRRSLPPLHRHHFRQWFADRPTPPPADGPRVILLDDCFTTFQEPRIGQAAVTVLERLGCRVELANICCGRAMISKGYLADAKELARQAIPTLAAAAREGVPILGMEPSCILTLADEWPELVPGEEALTVASAAELVESWIARRVSDTGLSLVASPMAGKALFHPHCHQRALVGTPGTVAALRLVPELEVEALDAGCCGMAGAFGFEKEHYDLSVAVANLELIPALKQSPDAVIVATGTSCRHQIHDLTGRRALHPVEVLATGIGMTSTGH